MTIPEAIANLNHIYGMVSPDIQRSLDLAIKALERQQGRPQGEWKHIGGDEWVCSECGHVITTEGSWEHPLSTGAYHCENCGADMRPKGGAE